MNNRGLWIFLAAAILLGLLWQFVPLQNAEKRLAALPLVGTQYGGKDLPLSEFEKNFFYQVNILKRIYKVQGEGIFVVVLDGTENRHIVHDPYYCFKGSGWDITAEETISIPGGTASLVNIRKGSEEKEAMFWFGDGSVNYASPLKYWMETTWRRLSLGLSGPEPVLVLVQPIDQKTLDWQELPQQFPSLFKL